MYQDGKYKEVMIRNQVIQPQTSQGGNQRPVRDSVRWIIK